MNKEMSFESAMTELENTVRLLENGEMSLDESIAAFEKAVSLVGICNEKIQTAEGRVKILTEGKDGSITDTPFSVKDDAT